MSKYSLKSCASSVGIEPKDFETLNWLLGWTVFDVPYSECKTSKGVAFIIDTGFQEEGTIPILAFLAKDGEMSDYVLSIKVYEGTGVIRNKLTACHISAIIFKVFPEKSPLERFKNWEKKG